MRLILSILFAVCWCTFAVADNTHLAFWQSRDSNYNALTPLVTYVGPGDLIPSATGWYGLRAYNAAYATGTNKSVNLRRASDNATCDFVINISGDLGGTAAGCAQGTALSIAAFAGQDATATCTISNSVMSCTGASSTPTVFSSITGSGLTLPCYAAIIQTFTAGSGTVTVSNGSQSGAPCGTIVSPVSITFTYGLFVTEVYDQSGNNNHVIQNTTGNQLYLLPSVFGALPGMISDGAKEAVATIASTANSSMTAVAKRVGSFTTQGTVLGKTSAATIGFSTSANTAQMKNSVITQAATDSASHSLIGVFGSPGSLCVDNVCASATNTAPSAGTGLGFMSLTTSTGSPVGYVGEAGFWATTALSSPQITSLCHNQFTYWGTSTSC